MDIQVLSRKAEGLERRLQISVSATRVAEAKERAAKRVAQSVRLPGFRAGKAPAAIVRKKFAQEIEAEAIDQLMREAYESVIESEKLEPITQPHAHDVKFDDTQALTFELHCEVKPELALERLSGFRVTRPNPTVTDETVAAQLESMRDQRATWAPVEEKPREGDMVTVTLAVADDDGTIAEGKEYRLVIGEGQAISAIEEVILGLAPGASTEQLVKWPDDFPDEAQRGKSKQVRAALSEVKRKTLPALDDALARELGDFESLDALTKAVREDLEANAVREADAAARGALLEEIIGANPFDVPPSWVKQLVAAYAKAYQVPEGEIEQFADQFHATAERQVRRDLVIETIAQRQQLAATEKDVDEKVAEMAEKRGADVSQVYAALEKAGRLREIERGVTEERVFAWLLGQNTVEQA
ncbi:MAG: trigger factor [Gemmatimonadetes bacterium]|nr:trigger factor [Gemmatimonadota bacterium]MBI3568051.1 trigger factor [Gemmatimonadota bacterium]